MILIINLRATIFYKVLIGVLCSFLLLVPSILLAKPNLDLPVKTLEGQTQLLSSMMTNKPVYLKFWASWCKTCIKEMPHFQEMQARIGSDIDIISINIDINETDQKIQHIINKFGLSMPTVKDSQGKLAKELKFVGTPYHVLINTQGNVVHKGHLAGKKLDKKLTLLANDPMSKIPQVELLDIQGKTLQLSHSNNELSVLFFTATWCDWYLKETRPVMSKACIKGQHDFNTLVTNNPKVKWQVITSHLWTGPKELQEYITKFEVSAPAAIDTTGDLFFAYGIKSYPTAVVLKGQKVIFTTQDIPSLLTHLTL